MLISEIASWSQVFRCHLITPKPVFLIPPLGFSWLQLPPCLASFSSSLISFFELLLATAAFYPELVSFLALLLYGCHPVSRVCLPPSFGLLLVAATAVSQPCLPVLRSFSPFMILYLWFLRFLCLYTFGGISRLVSHALLAFRT